jgi:hypothetical protein
MALSADTSREKRNPMGEFRMPVAATTAIYMGALISTTNDTGVSTGYAIGAVEAAGNIVMGVAREHVDNSTGSAGDKFVNVEIGEFLFSTTDGTIADTGVQMYLVDDNEVDSTAGANSILAGMCTGWDSVNSKAWVRILPGGKK